MKSSGLKRLELRRKLRRQRLYLLNNPTGAAIESVRSARLPAHIFATWRPDRALSSIPGAVTIFSIEYDRVAQRAASLFTTQCVRATLSFESALFAGRELFIRLRASVFCVCVCVCVSACVL